MLESLFRGHKWPDGLDMKSLKLFTELHISSFLTLQTRHTRDAHDQGISREDHVQQHLDCPWVSQSMLVQHVRSRPCHVKKHVSDLRLAM